MKKILIILIILLSIVLAGCDSNNINDVEISTDGGWYVNTSESVEVNSYNKYRLIESTKTNSEDGKIIITLKFDKPIK